MAMNAFANDCWFTAATSGTSDFDDGSAETGYENMADSLVSGQKYSYVARHPSDPTIWEEGEGVYTSGSPGNIARTTIHDSSTGSKISFAVAPKVMVTPLATDMASLSHYIADTAPSSPRDNQRWTNSATGSTYVYYNDGSSSQWIEIGATGNAEFDLDEGDATTRYPTHIVDFGGAV
jgi:hypothetical protein